jgi:isopenicillin N synthase-like dioxygenase
MQRVTTRAYSTSRYVSSVVPVIDFGKFISGNAADKKKVAQQIGDACELIGFLVIKDHRVPQPVIDRAWTETRKFFDLPASTKELYTSKNEAEYPYGYVGFGKEILSAGKVGCLCSVCDDVNMLQSQLRALSCAICPCLARQSALYGSFKRVTFMLLVTPPSTMHFDLYKCACV